MKFFICNIVFFIAIHSLFAQGEIFVDIHLPNKIEAAKTYTIDIVLHKENVNGFAKLELYLPVGIDLSPIENAGATLIKQGQLIKYIWLELPASKDIKITANLSVDYRINGYKEIYGNFYYIQNKNRTKSSIGVIPFQIYNDNKWKTALSEKQEKEYPVISEPIKIKPQKLNQPDFYRVQIAAFKRKISRIQLAELFPETQLIHEEFIDGLYKYTIGDFATLEEAKDFKNLCGIYGAFVVKYENYQRVAQP